MEFYWPEIPLWLQWIIALISFVAFCMAVQPFLQMIYGQPRIRLDFGDKETNDQRFLKGEIFNEPITKGWFYKLGVRTEQAQDAWAGFTIEEAKTGRKIYVSDPLPKIYTNTGSASQRAIITASEIPAIVFIVTADKSDGKVKPADAEMELAEGFYTVRLWVKVGTDRKSSTKDMRIKTAYPYVEWI